MASETHLSLLGNEKAAVIEGVVEKVIFHQADDGFTVLSVLPNPEKKGQDPVSCVGHMAFPREGIRMRFSGKMVKHPRFGQQLSFSQHEEILPASTEGIRLYLASGLIKGVGAEMAGRIVEKFGDDTLRVIDEEPEKLRKVRGIGSKTLEGIISSWGEHKTMRDLLLFLRPHGISASLGVRIYRAYGRHAVEVVRENPFRMAMEVRGIGFETADQIARKLGFPDDHPLRIKGATLYMLQKASDDGHVFLPENELVERICGQTGATPEQAVKAINSLEKEERLVCEDQQSPEVARCVYLSRFHHCESKTAFYLKRLMNSPRSAKFDESGEICRRVLESFPLHLAKEQEKAVISSTKNKILVITGGPGTGKTTIINAIIKTYEQARAKILLAAPTGRAAKRMSETSGREARTIHRLLEYSPRDDAFVRNEDNPLACGLLVVDEASMMDTVLFYYLLKALPLGATLVLVGDVHQLPSVGPGNVLGDIIDSGVVPVVQLNEIFRQSAESEIICNAHLINKGTMPVLERNAQKLSDFYFIQKDTPDDAAALIVDLIKEHIPRKFGFDSINEVQLLTPMHKGAVGAEAMNSRLQQALNPNALEVRKGDRVFRLHDKVMQVRNNYDKDIFNGDIGRIIHIDPREKTLTVDFDGTTMPYQFEELDELVTAYAISIHKSQGSEYPAVVIPLMMQHYVLLQRNLVYTGVTRGKRLVILVGDRRALQIAIHNNKTSRRNTMLARRLADGQAWLA